MSVSEKVVTETLVEALSWRSHSYEDILMAQKTKILEMKLIDLASKDKEIKENLNCLVEKLEPTAWEKFFFSPSLWQNILGNEFNVEKFKGFLKKEIDVNKIIEDDRSNIECILSVQDTSDIKWDGVGLYGYKKSDSLEVLRVKNIILSEDIVLDACSENVLGELIDIPLLSR